MTTKCDLELLDGRKPSMVGNVLEHANYLVPNVVTQHHYSALFSISLTIDNVKGLSHAQPFKGNVICLRELAFFVPLPRVSFFALHEDKASSTYIVTFCFCLRHEASFSILIDSSTRSRWNKTPELHCNQTQKRSKIKTIEYSVVELVFNVLTI